MGTPEIIDFTRPDGSRKNLFVTNIPGTMQEDQVVYELTQTFRPYGLLYGIQVFPTHVNLKNKTVKSIPNPEKDASATGPPCTGYYAFVTFYASANATQAKCDVNGVVILADEECKVAFAKRKKEVLYKQQLYFSKCYELINHYLGFNAWSTQIKTVFEDKDEDDAGLGYVKYVCLVQLTVLDLHTDGIGVWKETVANKDALSKIQATARCKKLCHMRAVENAFSKVLLVVLGNGKVTVEIDTTRPEFRADFVPDEQLIKVNDLDGEPTSEAELEDVSGVRGDNLTNSAINDMKGDNFASNTTDDINVNILQELEEEMSP